MSNTLIQELHRKALDIAQRFKRCEIELLDVLQEMEVQKAYQALGYTGLFDYATKALGLSESMAYNFMAVVKKAKEVPQLKEEIKQGTLSVSKARKITPVLTPENQEVWLNLAKALPQKQLEREVAKAAPKVEKKERVIPVRESRVELRIPVSEQIEEKLRRVQDLLSQQKKKPCSLEESLGEVLEAYLERHDPVRKARRCLEKPRVDVRKRPVARQDLSTGGYTMRRRKGLAAGLKHQVMVRDKGQCTYVYPDGTRCGSRRWLDFHHVLPLSEGGNNTLANLTTLCAAHHRTTHTMQVKEPRARYG